MKVSNFLFGMALIVSMDAFAGPGQIGSAQDSGANAKIVKSLTGINTTDKSQCIIQIVKNDDKTIVKVSAIVKSESKVYGEQSTHIDRQELTLQSAEMEEKTNIYQKESSALNIENSGFTFETKYKGRLYEGDFKKTGTAELDLAKGTFKYNLKTAQYLKDHNGSILGDLFSFFPSVTSIESASCVDLK